jgi:tetratricopeptide (TPR) repeat protein
MKQFLLLVNAEGVASAPELTVRELREYPGEEGVSVHFRPVRNDVLFQSAKVGSELAYGLLLGEGVVRTQLWIEYEVRGPHVNVVGRSGDLPFALALLTARWNRAGGEYPAIAATGVLSPDEALVGIDPAPAVGGVAYIEAKMAAAVRALAGERHGVIFYPAADRARVEAWRAAAAVPPDIRLEPVATLEEALSVLGIRLEKVYLGNPYRGLEFFDYAHRSVFFGRDCEIRELAAQLLRREAAGTPGVLVEGASGSGKSSFLRAGILPALVNPRSLPPDLENALGARPLSEAASRAIWHPVLPTAGADEAALAGSIHRVWRSLPQFAEEPAVVGATFAELILLWRARWPRERRFVWILDQLEELFDLALGEAVIESFGRFLLDLQGEGAWILAAIRADAMPTLKRSAALRALFGSNEGQYYLAGLGPTALDDVICRPAKAAGLSFDAGSGGRRLDQILREEAYGDHENALPLLQLTLHELYRRRSGRQLTYAAYEALGGLSGAVAAIASAALKQVPHAAAVPPSRLFRSLVTVDESGTVTRRYALRSEVTEDPAQEQLLDALVNARLCVSDQREGQAVVALAHEAVLRTWPELADWLKQESRLLQLRDLAEHEARLWEQHARADAWLAPPSKLAALEPLEAAGVRLSGAVGEFIGRSRKRMRRSARLKQAAVGAVALLAIAASLTGVIAVAKQHEAQYEAARALRARDRATTEAKSARATASFLATIFNAPTPERSRGRPITARELLDAGARRLQADLVAAPEVRARLTEQIGNAYQEIGEYARAAVLLESAVDEYRALPNAPLEDRAEAYTALGQLYYATGKRASAERTLIRAMTLEAGVPPERRSPTPNLVYAQMEMGAGNFSAARTALGEARVMLRLRRHTPDREDYLLLLQYSKLYQQQGEYGKAMRFGLRALDTESRVLGPDDPAAVTAADNLDMIYQGVDDLAMAEKYGRRALALGKRIYGEQSRPYAHLLASYAIDVEMQGERGIQGANEHAEELFRRVLAIRLRTLGPHHQYTGTAYYDIATAVAARGRWPQALVSIRRAREIWESSEGADSPDAAFALAMEARILRHLGRPAAAVPLAERSLRIIRRLHMSNYELGDYVVSAAKQVDESCFSLGRESGAAGTLPRALAIMGSSPGAANEIVAECLDSYARALRGSRRFAEANEALARAAALRVQNSVASALAGHVHSNR